MNSELSGDVVIVKDIKGTKLHDKSHYGNMTEEGLQLSLIEALFNGKDKLEILKENEEFSMEDMFQLIRKKTFYKLHRVSRPQKQGLHC